MADAIRMHTPQGARTQPLPLENGDRLSRGEFEHRYRAMPKLKKAELIEGRVYIGPPVKFREHAEPHARIVTWLGGYVVHDPSLLFGVSTTVRLDLDNEPQPDAVLMLAPERGGRARIDDDGYIAGPPELVIEVAASSASYDLHEKLHAYRRNGVREYIVWRVLDQALDWFVLRGSEFVPREAEGTLLTSTVFPGLWLDRAALLAGDMNGVCARLDEGLKSPDHAAFCGRPA